MDCIRRNGDITGYSVSYEEVERGSTETMSVSGDFNGGMVTITGLSILTRYTIRVAAETSAGTGVYSDSVAFETPDCEYILHVDVITSDVVIAQFASLTKKL